MTIQWSRYKKARYRSQAGRVYYDVLKVFYSVGEMPATRITYHARMPYDRLKPLLDKLAKKQLVERVVNNDKVLYRVTWKGYEAMKELKMAKRLLETLGLRF